jgi:hypothetical protein
VCILSYQSRRVLTRDENRHCLQRDY